MEDFTEKKTLQNKNKQREKNRTVCCYKQKKKIGHLLQRGFLSIVTITGIIILSKLNKATLYKGTMK